MQHFKQKKIVLVFIGAVAATFIILYLWVGAFVLQIFPRNEPQDPARVTNTEELGKDFRNGDYGTLGEIDEKPVPPQEAQTAPQSSNSQRPPAEPKKTVPASEKAILRQFGL